MHSAVPVVEYPVAHVTAMPVPVTDSTAEGVVPLAAAVAGHGSSIRAPSNDMWHKMRLDE